MDSFLDPLRVCYRVEGLPYLLHPYGNFQLLKSLGQIDLLCETNKRYKSLTFQILPREVMINKPGLLSRCDCEALGLITIRAHKIFSLISAVKDSSGKRAPPTQPAHHRPIQTISSNQQYT